MIGYLAVFLGGGLGSLSRYGISKMFYSAYFPLGTLIANFLSCAFLAIALFYFGEKLTENNTLRLLIITGFCGGFSTFSTFSYETFNLFQTGATFYAILNIVISLVFCISLIWGISKLV